MSRVEEIKAKALAEGWDSQDCDVLYLIEMIESLSEDAWKYRDLANA